MGFRGQARRLESGAIAIDLGVAPFDRHGAEGLERARPCLWHPHP